MTHYTESTYGDSIADVYDDWYRDIDPDIITTLAGLARGGRALEMGIGSGRIALPLQAAGVTMHGIDASPAMVARLREKPGGATIPVAMGNFADVDVEGQFDLVFIVFNTFFALPSQAEQVRCFANVARHLAPDGAFVLEVFAPDVARYNAGRQSVRVVTMDDQGVRLDVAQYDPVKQRITVQHVHLSPQGVQLYPVQLRFAWPAELDLMAQLAGLQLQQRWGGWHRGPFTADSARHISVYGFGPAV
jgi:SAM-dependent methyltransferase